MRIEICGLKILENKMHVEVIASDAAEAAKIEKLVAGDTVIINDYVFRVAGSAQSMKPSQPNYYYIPVHTTDVADYMLHSQLRN